MQKVVFYIFYPFIWLLSKAAFPVLYVISDFLYLVIFYLVGYRKKLVLSNLKRAFPNKPEQEILKIRRKFYHHFVDIFMEMIKTFTISEKQMMKHYKFKNLDLLENLAKKGKSVIFIGSHYANWEWFISVNLHLDYSFYASYTRISNKVFERKLKKSRERFGINMVLTKDTIPTIAKNYKENKIGFYGLLSDQSSEPYKTYYWSDFLGVRVPIHTGAEMLAKKYNCTFVIMEIDKVKRGYYEVAFELVTEHPRDFADYKLTDIFLEKLERQIRKKPEYYFWTHNRFKHEGKEEVKQPVKVLFEKK